MGEEILQSLQAVFTTIYAAYYNAQVSHWHVTGIHFQSLHSFFQDEYEWLVDKVDVVAEHIRTHDGRMPESLRKLGEGTPERSFVDVSDSNSILTAHMKYLRALEYAIVAFARAAEAANGYADTDLAGELDRDVKKSIWKTKMLLTSTKPAV